MSGTQELPAADRAAIERAAALVGDADAIIIAAGAGMGVDSGLPDFRGNAGFWKAYPALATAGTAFMDIASPAAFFSDPRRAWGFYGHRLHLYRRCELLGPLPACPHCGDIACPNILMFDDDGWIGDAREMQAVRCQGWLEQVRRPLMIELGASLNIPTVRHFAHRVVHRHGGSLLRINPREAHTGGLPGIGIAGTAPATLAAIDAVLNPS